MRFFATALIICGVVASQAQTPAAERIQVPETIRFAGMILHLREDVRAEIQKDVNALTQSPKYYNIKVERARTYFPIIERIFAEERVPTDFRFLVLQESALIADAVSETNAVGFWQFKDFTASEMGLRVDAMVDERMNIVSSTRAAARYIKQNNYMFNNWVYALQAYQMGAGGVKRMVGDVDDGARTMEITPDTYWYVKKYLAHKVAFEEAVEAEGQVKITEVDVPAGGAVTDIALRANVDEAQLRTFNKWIRGNAIPADRTYVLVVPSGNLPQDFSLMPVAVVTAPSSTPSPVAAQEEEDILINEIPVIQARDGESLEQLALRSGLDLSHFVKYNELADDHRVVAGSYYFKAKKKSHTQEEYHRLKAGEDLWMISQMYGIHVKKLRKYNHLSEDEVVVQGTMIWLNSTKPRGSEAPDSQEDVIVLGSEFMDWSAKDASGDHIVRGGETLYGIAKLYNISVEDLRQANDLEGADLKPGQRLKIVRVEVARNQKSGIVHEVQRSETLYSVAKRYGISVQELMESNNKKDFSVALGEKLMIPAR
jgi:membrane-bound lytic murein transglycosylase D